MAFVRVGDCWLNFSSFGFLCSQLQPVYRSLCACCVLLTVDSVLNAVCIAVLGCSCVLSVPLVSVPSWPQKCWVGTTAPEYHYPELLFHVATGGIIFPSSTCKIWARSRCKHASCEPLNAKSSKQAVCLVALCSDAAVTAAGFGWIDDFVMLLCLAGLPP